MKTSMRDVADHAGVSVATVSHVINKTRYVSPETVDKVERSIRLLGYHPDPIGRIFKTGKKNLIGFIVPDISNSVWALVIEAVETVLANYGFKLIIVNTKETKERELENISLLSSGIVDGLIIASTLEDFQEIKTIVPEHFPMVLIDRILPNACCDSVIPQDYSAVYEGIRRMVELGHTQIGFITGLMRLSTSQERLSAYRKAMADFGLPVKESYIQYGNSMAKSAVSLVRSLLDEGCTALAVSNNVMTGDILQYLDGCNLKVGRDISLFGQGIEGQTDYNLCRMDLMIQPSYEIGRLAGQQILERLAHPDLPIRNIVLSSTLLHRSLSPLPQK